jgi:hypothetical protein
MGVERKKSTYADGRRTGQALLEWSARQGYGHLHLNHGPDETDPERAPRDGEEVEALNGN